MSKTTRDVPAIVDEPSASEFAFPVTDNDRLALERMAAVTGVSLQTVVRLALWKYAQFLEVDLPLETFGARRRAIRPPQTAR